MHWGKEAAREADAWGDQCRGQSKLGQRPGFLKPDMIRMDSATMQTHVSKYDGTAETIRGREKRVLFNLACANIRDV